MNIVAIVQARMGSTRLPGKVMLDLAGQPMLAHVVQRLKRAKTTGEVVIATTTSESDNDIIQLCRKNGWEFFRGSENDVLDRYYQAVVQYKADIIVRITSDCPFIEPLIVDEVVTEFISHLPDVDYVANVYGKRTYPRGLDTEVISFQALKYAWTRAKDLADREHVTSYIYRNPDKFKLYGVQHPVDYSAMRWTVDTPEDFEFVRRVYDHFQGDDFSWLDVLDLLKKNPEWLRINENIQQKVH